MAAQVADLAHQAFVYLTGQYHLHHFCGLFIGNPQTIHKLGVHVHTLQGLVDLRTAAVHQHHMDTDGGQEYQIVHDGFFQFFIDHGVAAVFYNNDFLAVHLNVRQSSCQDLRLLVICNFHTITPFAYISS